MAALARPLVAPAPAVSSVVAVPPGPADAARVASWKLMLAEGASVELTFASPGDLEASRLALLVGGFTLGAAAGRSVVATKAAARPAAKRTLLRKKRAAAAAPAPAAQAALAGLGDDDLVDEDDLLAADGLAPPEVSADAGCSARAPCANCSCGRREALDAENASEAAAGAPPPATSACGNCGKGDAFRCAGCPHLGKPAFKANEPAGKLVLDLTDDFDL